MAMKGSGSGKLREIDRWDDGVGWIAYPDEGMQRASHAVVGENNGLWVMDPVDADGLDDLLAEHGEVEGVVTLLDRHKRDADAVSRRHEVPVYVPHWMSGVASELDAPVERIRNDLGDSGYGVYKLIDNMFWQEAVMFGEHNHSLIVPEAVGTAEYFRTGDRPLGVHPMLRLSPPKKLGRFDAERIRVGHGDGVGEDAEAVLAEALSGARKRAPKLYAKTARDMIFG